MRHDWPRAFAVPAVDFTVPTAEDHLASIHVGAAEAGQLIAHDVRIMRACRPVVRERLVQVVLAGGLSSGCHGVVLTAEQQQSKLLEGQGVCAVCISAAVLGGSDEARLRPCEFSFLVVLCNGQRSG
eukprot:7375875-Prymnesium_polylepis.5